MGVSVDPRRKTKSWSATSEFLAERKRREEEDYLDQSNSTADSVAKAYAEKEAEKKKQQEEIKRKAEGKLAYKSIFERIGDAFEANSPQDKAKRLERGEPENYQHQQALKRELGNRAETLNFASDEIKNRQDFYKRQGIDLEKTIKAQDTYKDIYSNKKIDYKTLAERAYKDGIIEKNSEAEKDYLDAAKFINPKTRQGLYRQALVKSLPGLDNKKISEVEKQYLALKDAEKGQSTIPQVLRRTARGIAKTVYDLPNNALTVASSVGDLLSAEGSTADKLAQRAYNKSVRDAAANEQKLTDAGLGVSDRDNPIIGGIAEGVGSLMGSASLGKVLGIAKAGEAKTAMQKIINFLKPGKVGSIFGVNEAGEIIRDATESGASNVKALASGAISGYAEAILENWGLGRLFGAKGRAVKELFNQALTEGSQEFLQDITTSGVIATYKDVDWGNEIIAALQSGAMGAVIGGGAGIGVGLSNQLQKRGVPQDEADAIGMRFEDDLKNKAIEIGNEGQAVEPPVAPPVVPVEQPTEPVQPIEPIQPPVEQPTIPPTDTPVRQTKKYTIPPELEQTEAASDWEENYAEKYEKAGELVLTQTEEELKALPKKEREAIIKKAQDEANARQVLLEEEWIKKWKDVPNQNDSGLRPKGSLKPLGRSTPQVSKNVEKIYSAFKNEPDATILDTINGLRGYENAPTYQALKKIANERKIKNPVSDMIVGSKEWNDYHAKLNEQTSVTKPKVTMQEGRNNLVLDKKIRYNGNVMTRREYVDALLKDGYTPAQRTINGKTKYVMESTTRKGDYYDVSKIEHDLATKSTATPQVSKTAPISEKIQKAFDNFIDTGDTSKINKGTATADIGAEQLADGTDTIYISEIFNETKGNKNASSLLDDIIKHADSTDTPVTLRANVSNNFTDGKGLSQEQLVKWYERKGFKPANNLSNFADDTDFMIYQPKPSAPQVSKTAKPKGSLKPIKNKTDIKLLYPEETKDLPEYMQKNIPKEKKISNLTPREVGELLLHEVGWKKTDLQKLVRLVPDIKQNPVLTIEETTGKDRHGNSVKDLYMVYDNNGHTGKILLKSVGLNRERLENSGIKAGMTIDISSVLSSKGRLPVINKGGVNYSLETDTEQPNFSLLKKEENPVEPLKAKTPEQLAEMASQLNKVGQKFTILRGNKRKSNKYRGVFQPPRKGSNKPGQIKITDKTLNNLYDQVSNLSHEMTHAIEWTVNGNNGHALDLFGELTKEEKTKIIDELKAITINMVGQEEYEGRTDYYNKRTELLARYVQQMVIDRDVASKLAPYVEEKFKEAMVRYPEIQLLMDAIDGKIDAGSKDWIFGWYRDMRQTYQHVLGKMAGDNAYNAEVVKRARQQAWEQQVGQQLKEKFKNVKDDQSLLFRAAESIKETVNGEVVYGTSDYITTKDKQEAQKLVNAGWKFVEYISKNGEDVGLFAKVRYTEEQAKAIFKELSPEGKQLIKDFTETKQEAKDMFNRRLLREMYKIDANIEGWVHRGLQDPEKVKKNKVRGLGKRGLKRQVAGMMRKRGGSDTYLEDFQKQITKAMLEAGQAKIHNEFINQQLARISKPIAYGQKPDAGWTEITFDELKGMMLPGEGGRERMSIDTIDEETGLTITKKFLKPQNHYQVPTQLAKHYRTIREVQEELTASQKFIETFAQYWAINVLVQGGTVGTNAISGGLQYSAKVINDMLLDVTYGDPTMKRTRSDIAAIVQCLLPKGWTDAPAYVYGGHRSNFAGQFMMEGKSRQAVNRFGDIALKPFSGVESYWKKAIITAEGSKNFKPTFSPTELVTFTKAEEAMIITMSEQADKYGFDYQNVPMWMTAWTRKGGTLIKPFMKYPYKYMKFITGHATRAVDPTLPWQERTASILTLTTLVAMFYGLMEWRDKEKETPDGAKTRGRMFLGKIGTKEWFMRVSKYPFVNITAAGRSAIKGDWDESWNILKEQVGTLGPVATPVAVILGYRDQYNTYTPQSVMWGKQVVSVIPGFRLLNDIGNLIDNTPRKATNFIQAIGGSLPIFGSEDTKRKYRGNVKTVKVPDESKATQQLGKNATTDKEDAEMYRTDTALSALTGLYTTRLDPEVAKAEEKRTQRQDIEDEIYNLLRQYKYKDAQAMAEENGLWISKRTLNYYRSAQKKNKTLESR